MKQILASVIIQGFNQEVTFCQKPINCDEAQVKGIEWFVPVVENGLLKGYRSTVYPTKPQPDAVKAIRVQQGGQTLYIAIADNATLASFADACNLCCDEGTPTLAAPTLIGPFIEDEVCPDVDGNHIYRASIPAIISGQKLHLDLVTCNMTATDTPNPAGFSTAAALRDWANANISDVAGTFSIETHANGDFLKLVSPDCSSAALNISLLKQKWCAPITFPVTYNTIIHNGVTKTLSANKTAANATEFISQVASYYPDGLLTSEFTGKIQYEGTGAPATVKLNTTTKGTFTVGACTA